MATRKRYAGPPLERGGTSIPGKLAPALQWLLQRGMLQPGMTVLDYGAGKYARNADPLRRLGINVYAYDPFNGVKGADPWALGSVSKTAPSSRQHFDAAFTAFVLNVVPDNVEDEILDTVSALAPTTFHITRNMDIFDTAARALTKADDVVTRFFVEEYLPNAPREVQDEWEAGELSRETVYDFCVFGTATSRGFQRIPVLEEKGYDLLRSTAGFKVYGG